MTDAIKLEIFDPDKVRHMVETFRRETEAELSRSWNINSTDHLYDRIERRTHPIHVFRLSTQDIRVAFDETTKTLYVGETGEGGWMLHQARREHEMGNLPYPFLREVERAHADMATSRRYADDARWAQQKHARLVREATERLSSRKPGVRRRAKRLLERLGK